MADFSTALVEGIFALDGTGQMRVEGEDGVVRSLEETLRPMVGSMVHLAAHFLPVEMDPTRWGFGSCRWQPSECPAGHHKNPTFLLSVKGEGVLHGEDGCWWVETFAGLKVEIPLDQLNGHHGRVAAATAVDVEAMREKLSGISPDDIDAIGVQAEELKSMLGQLAKFTGGEGNSGGSG